MGTIIYNFYCDEEIDCEDVIDQLRYDCAFGKCKIRQIFVGNKYYITAQFNNLSNEDHTGIDEHFRADYPQYDGWNIKGDDLFRPK